MTDVERAAARPRDVLGPSGRIEIGISVDDERRLGSAKSADAPR